MKCRLATCGQAVNLALSHVRLKDGTYAHLSCASELPLSPESRRKLWRVTHPLGDGMHPPAPEKGPVALPTSLDSYWGELIA